MIGRYTGFRLMDLIRLPRFPQGRLIWGWFGKLKKFGVVGLNGRNGAYVLPNNPRRLYPLVDDKITTKELTQAAGLNVPELYGVFRAQHELKKLPGLLQKHDSFVVKPARGAGGNGILVITGKLGPRFRKPDDSLVAEDAISFHISNILSGMYSLGGMPDKAMLEYCVQFSPIFKNIAYQGVPDIRIIVYKGIPVMAMLRLPTRESDGKSEPASRCYGLWNRHVHRYDHQRSMEK